MMQSNSTLQANFVANPFIPLRGSFNGLFFVNGGIRHDTSGFFTFALTERGNYSGHFQFSGKRHFFSGRFNLEGKATNSFVRFGTNLFSAEFMLDLNGGSDRVSGRLINWTAGWTANLLGDRAPVFRGTNSSPYRGRYTFAVSGVPGDASKPEGDGIGTVLVGTTGRLTLAGTLADGTKLVQSVPLSAEGTWPLYASVYAGRGSVWSWVVFDTNRVEDDLRGALTWTRPTGIAPRFYTNGIVLDTVLSGARYVPPAAGTRIITVADGMLVIGGGDFGKR